MSIKNETQNITIDPEDNKKIIRKYYEQLNSDKLDNFIDFSKRKFI